MKIASFTQRWISGGKEAYLVNNFENMNLSGLDITILTSKKETDFFDIRLNELGIDIIELTSKTYGPFMRPLYVKKALAKHLENNTYDVLHFNIDNGVNLGFAKIASKIGVTNIVVHSHNSDTGGGVTRPLKIMAHRIGKMVYMKYPTDYWACSDFAAQWLFSKSIVKNKQYSILKNGIDIDRVAFNQNARKIFRKEVKVNDNDYLIGTIGRLSQQKNQLFLLDIMHDIVSTDKKIKLLIVGEGELYSILKDKCVELGIQNNVILYGKTENIKEALSAMDLFILPSKFEGFPLSAVEAQANGLSLLISNDITETIKITKAVKFLSIQDRISWTKNILERNKNEIRDDGAKIVYQKGFDLKDTAIGLKMKLISLSDKK